MYALFQLINTVISIYIWIILAQVILSWLVHLNVVNTRNRFVYLVGDTLFRLTEPALRPIRKLIGKIIPSSIGLDISPMVLIILLWFVRNLINVDIAQSLM